MKPVLKKRLFSAAVISAIVLTTAFLLPSMLGCVLILVLATAGILEFYKMLDLCGIPSFRILGAVSGIILITTTWLSLTAAPDAAIQNEYELFMLFAIIVAAFMRLFPQKHNEQPFSTVACTMLGVLYVPFLLNFITKLGFFWHTGGVTGPVEVTGRRLVMYMLVVVKLTDVGAYFIGSAFGKHKLFHRISPKKTWEGFFGGIATGVMSSILFYLFSSGNLGVIKFEFSDALILGILLPSIGVVGDLAESMLKRISGSKDSGKILPGMGGALDILDSVLFAAPAMFIYTRLFLS